MFTHALVLAAALLTLSASPVPVCSTGHSVVAPLGGPLRISLADKDKGEITRAQWTAARTIELHGCIPDARITSVTISTENSDGKEMEAKGNDATITAAMRTLIANLPVGTAFYIEVRVVDGKNKNWQVPTAAYVWKG